jgi:hypothetical protein
MERREARFGVVKQKDREYSAHCDARVLKLSVSD